MNTVKTSVQTFWRKIYFFRNKILLNTRLFKVELLSAHVSKLMQSGDNESDIQVNAFQIKIYLTSYDLVGVNNFLDCHFEWKTWSLWWVGHSVWGDIGTPLYVMI